jgi:hypothetical protein
LVGTGWRVVAMGVSVVVVDAGTGVVDVVAIDVDAGVVGVVVVNIGSFCGVEIG